MIIERLAERSRASVFDRRKRLFHKTVGFVLEPEPDILRGDWHVRFGSKTDVTSFALDVCLPRQADIPARL